MDKQIREWASLLGFTVAKHPFAFISIPLCFFSLFVFPFISALQQLFDDSSAIGSTHLFLPDDSANQAARIRMQMVFPDGGYFSDRTFLSSNLRVVLLEAKSGNIFEERFIEFYSYLRKYLENISIMHKGETLSYATQCDQQIYKSLHCLPDAFILANSLLGQLSPLTFPYWNISIFNVSRSLYVGALFGGVHIERSTQLLKSSRFVKMPFNLPPILDREDEILFEQLWIKRILALSPPEFVGITTWSHGQHEHDMKLIALRTRRLLPVLVIALMLFCTISTMRRDRALSKSILALCGVISAGCAVITSFGLLYVCGVRLIQIALITPFLVLSIGIDDMFLMIATWNRIVAQNKSMPLVILIQKTYDVGTISIFPIMRIFCIYCVVSLIVVFVFQATLFGACITLDGAKQFTSQSSFICIPLRCRRSSRSMKVSESNRSSFVSQYSLWSVFTSGPFITLILLSYIVYLSASITILNNNIELGLQLSSLLPEDSETYAYLRVYERHFSEYTVPMEVLIDGNLEYSSPTIRHNILRAVNAIENSEYSLKASFWLNDFHNFLRKESINSNEARRLLRSDEKRFFYTYLTDVFLRHPAYRHYTSDMLLINSSNGSTYINASRFFIPLRNINRHTRLEAMHSLRALVENVSIRFSMQMIPMHVAFDLAEQDERLPSIVLFNTFLAGFASILSTIILIPSIRNCILMAWATLSINIGVIALLSICGTRLDIISTIILLLSIGYSVDFSSHLLVHFHHSHITSDEPLAEALSTVAWPIVQSSLSTVIGIACISPVNGYIAESFVKGVLFVCTIGFYHSIVVLPAILTLLNRKENNK